MICFRIDGVVADSSFESIWTPKKGDEVMNEAISKAVLSGLGFASLTRDAIHETAQHLIAQSRLTEEEGRRVVEEFQRRAVKAEKALEKKVHAAVRNALKQLDRQPARHVRSTKASAKSNSHRGRKNTRAASTH